MVQHENEVNPESEQSPLYVRNSGTDHLSKDQTELGNLSSESRGRTARKRSLLRDDET